MEMPSGECSAAELRREMASAGGRRDAAARAIAYFFLPELLLLELLLLPLELLFRSWNSSLNRLSWTWWA